MKIFSKLSIAFHILEDLWIAQQNISIKSSCKDILSVANTHRLLVNGYYRFKTSLYDEKLPTKDHELVSSMEKVQSQLLVDRKHKMLVCDGGSGMYESVLMSRLNTTYVFNDYKSIYIFSYLIE